VARRYHKLPDSARYSMLVAFEGESKLGTRHAHLLVYVPKPKRRTKSHEMTVTFLPQEFRFLWNRFRPNTRTQFEPRKSAGDDISDAVSSRISDEMLAVKFKRATEIQAIYTIKSVRLNEVPWSRLEFVTPPKTNVFSNKNLNVIKNRDKQRHKQLRLN
jgi:hypothetical protein